MRAPFSDGFNSLVHLGLGFLAGVQPILTPFFIAYQFLDVDENTMLDLGEFAIGFFVATWIK